jgi:GNAT superfamily N-acetyltransferase
VVQPRVRKVREEDRPWVVSRMSRYWGSHLVVSRGRLHDTLDLPAFLAELQGRRVGLLTYRLDGAECEVVTLHSEVEGRGIGTSLIEAVKEAARDGGANRLWLITTNDNLKALGFYQRRGFVLVRVHRGAIKESRRLKPEIPLIAPNGIPILDEIELEMILGRPAG